jgi:hypothetical protein
MLPHCQRSRCVLFRVNFLEGPIRVLLAEFTIFTRVEGFKEELKNFFKVHLALVLL